MEQTIKRLVSKYPDRFRWWEYDRYVLGPWRDRATSDQCLEAFAAFIQAKGDECGACHP